MALLERRQCGSGSYAGSFSAGGQLSAGSDEDDWVRCELERGTLSVGGAAESPSSSLVGITPGGGSLQGALIRGDACSTLDGTYFEEGTRLPASTEVILRAYPQRVGLYTPLITIGGRHFRPPDPDYMVHVRAGPPAAQRSFAQGVGLAGGEVGSMLRFRVAVLDAYGNFLSGRSDVVRVQVCRKSTDVAMAISQQGGFAPAAVVRAAAARAAQSARTSPCMAPSTDGLGSNTVPCVEEACVVALDDAADDDAEETRGMVRATFVPRHAGAHLIQVFVGEAELHGSPFTAFFSAGSLNPAMCVVRGAGLRKATAGVGSVVEIAAHDAEGNVLFHSDMSGSEFVASLATADGTTVDCVSRCFDRGDGTYRLAYTTFTARTGLLLSITGRGAHVKGSPFAIDVVSGRAHAPHCHVHGAGAAYAQLGSATNSFMVYTHDRWRNPCTSGGERIHVRFAGPTHPICNVLDLGDGTYRVNARYGLSGVYQLTVAIVQGEKRSPVPGSPFAVYAGLRLAEQYLVRWLGNAPRSLSALAADSTGGRLWAGGSTHSLQVARLGSLWQHDCEALLAHSLRAWKLFVARRILDRFVAGDVPTGSPRVVTNSGTPVTRAHGLQMPGRASQSSLTSTPNSPSSSRHQAHQALHRKK